MAVVPLFFRYLLAVLRALRGHKWASPLGRLLGDKHRLFYFHLRYLGLKTYLKYADAFILSHECIIDGIRRFLRQDQKILGVIYPTLKENEILEKLRTKQQFYKKNRQKIFIEVTGSVTPYRQKWIKSINNFIQYQGLSNVFGYCVAFSFSAEPRQARGFYSLHPPQTKNWRYSSPTRIYRALAVDSSLPILTHYFGQNPIEDVCFVIDQKKIDFLKELYELYLDYQKLRHFLAPRIANYNRIANQRNDALAAALDMLARWS
jgi:hypothetical protein